MPSSNNRAIEYPSNRTKSTLSAVHAHHSKEATMRWGPDPLSTGNEAPAIKLGPRNKQDNQGTNAMRQATAAPN